MITTMSKVLFLPRNLQFEVKPLRSLGPVTKSRLCITKTRGSPYACHEMSENACAAEMHFEDVERHECTANSSELAVDVGARQRSKHSC